MNVSPIIVLLEKLGFSSHALVVSAAIVLDVAAFVTGLTQVLPGDWTNAVLATVAVASAAAKGVLSILGKQRWESSPAGQNLTQMSAADTHRPRH